MIDTNILIERFSTAETVEERANATADLVEMYVNDVTRRCDLLLVIASVRLRDYPPALLTGVVYDLLSDRLESLGRCADRSGWVAVLDGSGVSHKAKTREGALAVAILRTNLLPQA